MRRERKYKEGILYKEYEEGGGIIGKEYIYGRIYGGAMKIYLCHKWVSVQNGSVTFAPAEWGNPLRRFE